MKTFNTTLQEVMYFVLDEWAMMLADPDEAAEVSFDPESIYYVVIATYHGVFDGTLSIIAQNGFIELLTDNLLGIDPGEGLSQEDKLDALKELANVVSGNFLVEAFGKETVFELPSFESFCVEPQDIHKFLNDDFVYCVGDEQVVALDFNIRSD
ncbi:MAG: chemotaxis protein CheX [Deltaproteobacteria bacterium]|nr:chemotaxis protein CheX [Deltaproteobacteria bacterium]